MTTEFFSHRRFAEGFWTAPPNRLSRAMEAARRDGRTLLDLTLANPTVADLPYPTEEILSAFRATAMLRYDPAPFGRRDTREALAGWLRTKGILAHPDRLILTASTSEAYSWLLTLCTDPGDEVIAPVPSYPLLEYLAALALVHVEPFALRRAGASWHIDPTALDAALGPRTRACVVVHPNNPTGHYTRSKDWELLLDRCARGRMPLVVDEVFHDFAFGEKAPSSACLESEVPVFTLGGLSKSLGLPQMKLGWILVTGPDELVKDALLRLEGIADTYLSVGAPIQAALPALLATAPAIQASIMERCRRNLATLEAVLPAAHRVPVEAGWYAAFRTGRDETDEDTAVRLVHEHGVLVHPGYFFDFRERDWLAVSLLSKEDEFEKGLRVLSALYSA